MTTQMEYMEELNKFCKNLLDSHAGANPNREKYDNTIDKLHNMVLPYYNNPQILQQQYLDSIQSKVSTVAYQLQEQVKAHENAQDQYERTKQLYFAQNPENPLKLQ
ncbi:Hypothetical_protein [Hexamita inflata]|nr:Hypothetical protein HINF_LOCUS46950 [Hexamita inflata]